MRTQRFMPAWLLGVLGLAFFQPLLSAAEFASHPPMRPLPTASDRAMTDGPAYFVEGSRGNDASDGSLASPWRTLAHSLKQLKPGDTLYLRGGVYHEHVVMPRSGEPGKPITIRSYPNELATIDGGLREFHDHPAASWEPLAGGAEGEFVSTKKYPQFSNRPILASFLSNGWEPFIGIENQRPLIVGHFADSMVPLHGYRMLADLRDKSALYDIGGKFDKEASVYCGPGLWFNRETERIHVRLAHTDLEGLGKLAYRGETDPRKIALLVSGALGEDVLRINGVKHLVVQDLVFRGASASALVNLYDAEDITFDGVTMFGGAPALLLKATSKINVTNCAFRSLAAPWSSRASMKYRGTPSYVILADANQPENHDVEIAHCEFTDGHDGVYVRYIKNLKFHHNYIDNFNDDGFEVGAKKRDHEIYCYQNRFSRTLINFTLHEIVKDESPATVDEGSGVYIARNVVDLRQGTFKSPPNEQDPTGAYLNQTGMLCSDHGGPTWPHYYFYHNTVLRSDPSFRGYYGFSMGGQGLRNTQRRVFNNIFVQLDGVPGLNFLMGSDDVMVDGNLHWGTVAGPSYAGDFFKQSQPAAFKKTPPPPGMMEHDLFADPKFAKSPASVDADCDLTLVKGSPAINAGVAVPVAWVDPLREHDEGAPDLGAFPAGIKPWRVGVRGRVSIFGP